MFFRERSRAPKKKVGETKLGYDGYRPAGRCVATSGYFFEKSGNGLSEFFGPENLDFGRVDVKDFQNFFKTKIHFFLLYWECLPHILHRHFFFSRGIIFPSRHLFFSNY